MIQTNKVLIIATNVAEFEKVGYKTGLWLGELTHFWDVVEAAGLQMDIASPAGGVVPLDPASLAQEFLEMGGTDKRYADRDYMNMLHQTLNVSEVDAADYDAIYLTGGHGVSFDFPSSQGLADLIVKFHEAGKIVSAVCHGPAGFLEVKLSDGEYLINGKNVTGYSWKEEQGVERQNAVPFSLEAELQKRGANYSKALLTNAAHLVEDGQLITGQNPASAASVGKAVVIRLQAAA